MAVVEILELRAIGEAVVVYRIRFGLRLGLLLSNDSERGEILVQLILYDLVQVLVLDWVVLLDVLVDLGLVAFDVLRDQDLRELLMEGFGLVRVLLLDLELDGLSDLLQHVLLDLRFWTALLLLFFESVGEYRADLLWFAAELASQGSWAQVQRQVVSWDQDLHLLLLLVLNDLVLLHDHASRLPLVWLLALRSLVFFTCWHLGLDLVAHWLLVRLLLDLFLLYGHDLLDLHLLRIEGAHLDDRLGWELLRWLWLDWRQIGLDAVDHVVDLLQAVVHLLLLSVLVLELVEEAHRLGVVVALLGR